MIKNKYLIMAILLLYFIAKHFAKEKKKWNVLELNKNISKIKYENKNLNLEKNGQHIYKIISLNSKRLIIACDFENTHENLFWAMDSINDLLAENTQRLVTLIAVLRLFFNPNINFVTFLKWISGFKRMKEAGFLCILTGFCFRFSVKADDFKEHFVKVGLLNRFSVHASSGNDNKSTWW